jgi:hypothetical protein
MAKPVMSKLSLPVLGVDQEKYERFCITKNIDIYRQGLFFILPASKKSEPLTISVV